MIPIEYLIALFTSTLLVLYRLVDIKNKYVNILVNAILSFSTGAAWAYIMVIENSLNFCNDKSSFIVSLLIIILVGLIIGFMLMVITLHEPLYVQEKVEQELYTEDKLINMSGTVVQKYSEGSYLCKLVDKTQTSIVVYLDDAKENDKFIINKIENGKIFGSIVTL